MAAVASPPCGLLLLSPFSDVYRKMGYVDGKTDADLLIEEDPFEEDEERILILKVLPPSTPPPLTVFPSPPVVLPGYEGADGPAPADGGGSQGPGWQDQGVQDWPSAASGLHPVCPAPSQPAPQAHDARVGRGEIEKGTRGGGSYSSRHLSINLFTAPIQFVYTRHCMYLFAYMYNGSDVCI